ncbi:putative histone H3-like 3 [Polypedilum vanderplanki]|uniref:Histone H3-like 3 n=1 Tax=Polypedilum vanderplanki TaxID=319348 RepID=A0A9J6CQ22_POLVA|nr:putative histone H3-like 3 [Polypedilum vanderplanki]
MFFKPIDLTQDPDDDQMIDLTQELDDNEQPKQKRTASAKLEVYRKEFLETIKLESDSEEEVSYSYTPNNLKVVNKKKSQSLSDNNSDSSDTDQKEEKEEANIKQIGESSRSNASPPPPQQYQSNTSTSSSSDDESSEDDERVIVKSRPKQKVLLRLRPLLSNCSTTDDENEERNIVRDRSKRKFKRNAPKKLIESERVQNIEKANPKKRDETFVNKNGQARYKPGIRALKEIRKLQNSTKIAIPRVVFARAVKEILQDSKENFKIQAQALIALQEAAEDYIVNHFEMMNLAAIHAKRVTVMQNDSKLVKRIGKK